MLNTIRVATIRTINHMIHILSIIIRHLVKSQAFISQILLNSQIIRSILQLIAIYIAKIHRIYVGFYSIDFNGFHLFSPSKPFTYTRFNSALINKGFTGIVVNIITVLKHFEHNRRLGIGTKHHTSSTRGCPDVFRQIFTRAIPPIEVRLLTTQISIKASFINEVLTNGVPDASDVFHIVLHK